MTASKLTFGVVLIACVGAVGAAVSNGLSRNNLRSAEASGDESLQTALESNSLLGNTRAVYLQGYGVVFSAEVDVAPGSTPHPFRPPFTKEETARIKARKKERVAALRGRMQELMVGYAETVQVVPMNESIAMAVTVYYSKVEDTDGMPRQIVMSAPRSVLRSGNGQAIAANLKVQDFF